MLVKLMTVRASATSASSAVISLTRSGVRCDRRVIAFSGCRNTLSVSAPDPVQAMTARFL